MARKPSGTPSRSVVWSNVPKSGAECQGQLGKLAMAGFPGVGSYMGAKSNIGR